MSLRGALAPGERMSAAERAREPRSLGVIAFFDGCALGSQQGKRFDFPRRLDHAEAVAWREGFREGTRERRCHEVHGFWQCDTPGAIHPPDATDDRYTRLSGT